MPEIKSEAVSSHAVVNGINGSVQHPLVEANQVSPLTKPTAEPAFLQVIDSRTGNEYKLPIENNAVSANDFKSIKSPLNSEHYADQNEQGLRVYDPGFSNTAVSRSSITYIDGLKGSIQYRGYSIVDIMEHRKGFMDTAYLLIWGQWPSKKQSDTLRAGLGRIPEPPKCVFNTIRSFPREGSPIGMIIAGLSALQSTQMSLVPAHAAKNLYLGNPELVDREIIKTISSLSIITAATYCHHVGRAFTGPRSDLSYIENFLLMTGHVEEATGLPNPHYVSIFERLWVLLADHEMTCSTAALLQTASSLPDLLSCLISAYSATYGPLHGGAIEVAYKDIETLGTIENIAPKLERVKAGKERLFGYGHRIYRVEDPRYLFIKQIMEELGEEISNDPLLKVAFELDRVAQADEYFQKRHLKPNADLFAAFAYKAMGFPSEFILPISVLARSQGFFAHWKEAMSGAPRIWRPGQLYVGDLDLKIEPLLWEAGK